MPRSSRWRAGVLYTISRSNSLCCWGWQMTLRTCRGRRSLACSILLMAICLSAATADGKDDKDEADFPDDSQINLLLGQAERAFDAYENAVKLEELQLRDQKGAKGATTRDREVLDAARQVLTKLRSNPQTFNSPLGFLLVINLDDASRNMAVCGGQAAMLASSEAIAGNTFTVETNLGFGQTCMDASQLLYTISETATSMYEKYLLSNAVLQGRAVDAVRECTDILKKQAPQPLKK